MTALAIRPLYKVCTEQSVPEMYVFYEVYVPVSRNSR